jgi:hypothetical protein
MKKEQLILLGVAYLISWHQNKKKKNNTTL